MLLAAVQPGSTPIRQLLREEFLRRNVRATYEEGGETKQSRSRLLFACITATSAVYCIHNKSDVLSTC